MKMLEHPNIVNLIEVIDDPTTDHFYMGIFYSISPRLISLCVSFILIVIRFMFMCPKCDLHLTPWL